MNRVLLTGRLTRDSEMRTVATGKTVTQVFMEVSRNDEPGRPPMVSVSVIARALSHPGVPHSVGGAYPRTLSLWTDHLLAR